jgi:hypothetical protein
VADFLIFPLRNTLVTLEPSSEDIFMSAAGMEEGNGGEVGHIAIIRLRVRHLPIAQKTIIVYITNWPQT